jgi:phosphoribosyl 1,2-cyclic phosphodiesterase/DNA-binding response OmpR family regulator
VRVQFWGTRGSLATPGPATARYGGNTSCIEVRSARGTLVVIDCGTGGHALARKLASGDVKRLRGNILISHTHWDHIQGIPFFDPLYVRGTEWDIYGPSRGLRESLRDALAGQMQYVYFPVSLDQFQANIRYHDLTEGMFSIDDIRVSAQYLNHPVVTLGYRLQVDGATLVYACDHEPHSRTVALGDGKIIGEDLRHAEFLDGADLLIHDAQYTAEEYPEKIGWGHSPVEYVMRLAEHACVKRLALTHHDPRRDDNAIEGVVARLRESSPAVDVFPAFEGQVVELGTRVDEAAAPSIRGLQAEIPPEHALGNPAVLLAIEDTTTSDVVSDVLKAENIIARPLPNIADLPDAITKDGPSLAILEHDPPRLDGIRLCRAIRRQAPEHRLAVLMVAREDNQDAGTAADVSDWLIKPFTVACARTKIRTWLLRAAGGAMERAGDAERREAAKPLRIVHTAKPLGVDESTKVPRVSRPAADRKQMVVSPDKSALLWMYGREIAAFDTPGFSTKLGEIIARASTRAQLAGRSR